MIEAYAYSLKKDSNSKKKDIQKTQKNIKPKQNITRKT
jgi:hypothetical protein